MIKFMNKKTALILIAIIGSLLFFNWQNNDIVITKFEYSNNKIPIEFNNFKIAHISDLHNKEFGFQQEYIIRELKSTSPDIIVITGDLIDRRKYNLEIALTFVRKAVKLAPVYYVTGNHEAWSGKYDDLRNELTKTGVNVLDNTAVKLTKGKGFINILGLEDLGFLTASYIEKTDTSEMESNLQNWSKKKGFKILLSHRPQFFDLYKKYNMDIVFSGHAHGGQVRLPFIGGIFAPDQGLFPKYDSGQYHEDSTDIFISRGLGNSIIPIRIFNRPEIITVTLKSKG